jgi:hypothetical protein
MSPEICICAALRLSDGRIVRGHRHDDCFRTLSGWMCGEVDRPEQGFVTSRNRFVDRVEAFRLQKAAHVESLTGYRGEQLFSEDLY